MDAIYLVQKMARKNICVFLSLTPVASDAQIAFVRDICAIESASNAAILALKKHSEDACTYCIAFRPPSSRRSLAECPPN